MLQNFPTCPNFQMTTETFPSLLNIDFVTIIFILLYFKAATSFFREQWLLFSHNSRIISLSIIPFDFNGFNHWFLLHFSSDSQP